MNTIKRLKVELGISKMLPIQIGELYGLYDRGDSTSKHIGTRDDVITWFARRIKHTNDKDVFDATRSKLAPKQGGLSALFDDEQEADSKTIMKKWKRTWVPAMIFDNPEVSGALRVKPVQFTEKEAEEIFRLVDNWDEMQAKKRKKKLVSFGATNLDLYEPFQRKKEKVKANSNIKMELFNVEPSAEFIVNQIETLLHSDRRPPNITALFHGLPGTGKTELAREIGRLLGKPIMKKTYGEIQAKYVGEGEKNLADAFEDATEEGAILLIDEIDSLAANRELADKEFTKTMTNQLLTELDEFKGIFIGTTNFTKSLDPAVLRRLHLKLEFKALCDEGREIAFRHFFGRLKPTEELFELPYLTPGDFHAVRSKALYVTKKPTGKDYVNLLKEEIELKLEATPALKEKAGRKNPIGFGLTR